MAVPELPESQVITDHAEEFVAAFKQKDKSVKNEILNQLISALVAAGCEYAETYVPFISPQASLPNVTSFKGP